ncbi:MAG: exonuclease SbcCD subunit D [Halanaerobiales bacterium]
MRLLHTADWHLGKHLEGHSRLQEQERFVEELTDIVEENDVDMILISGDIYDTFNPPADAEHLFYKSVKELSDNGKRVVCIIAGNHDSPKRLMASYPIASEQGIIIVGYPDTEIRPGKLGKYQIIAGGKGYLELEIKGERVVILTLPYPSESRLQEAFDYTGDDRDIQIEYSGRVADIFHSLEEHYRADTINIAASHLFVAGGKRSDSERIIQVGGGMTVDTESLPLKSQYTALGHLHRPQIASKSRNAYYAGSPLQYSKSEIGYAKTVNLVDLHPGEEADITHIKLCNRKPIEVWEVNGVNQALEKCRKNQDREVWAYLQVHTDQPLLQTDIKEIKSIKPDLLSIVPFIKGDSLAEDIDDIDEDKDIIELFQEFYKNSRGTEPADKVLKMFATIVEEKEDTV